MQNRRQPIELRRPGALQSSLFLNRLSDDILALILSEYIYNPTAVLANERLRSTLSLVCRKLRALVCSSAKLWACLRFEMTRLQLNVCLLRSKEADLTILVRTCDLASVSTRPEHRTATAPYPRFGTWCRFLAASARASHRWSVFVFRPLFAKLDRAYYPKLCHAFEGVDVSRLREISLYFPRDFTEGLEGGDSTWSFEVVHFYKTWTTPNLRNLKAINIVPLPNLGASLTSCQIILSGKRDLAVTGSSVHRWQLTELLAFLSAAPVLRSLDIHICSPMVVPIAPIVINTLMHLDFVNFMMRSTPCPNITYTSTLERFMRSLRTPSLKAASIALNGNIDEAYPREWLHSFLPETGRYQFFTELRFCAGGRGVSIAYSLWVILGRLPNLQYLILELPREFELVDTEDAPGEIPPGPLNRIILEEGSYDLIMHVLSVLNWGWQWYGLQEVVAVRRIEEEGVNWRALDEFVPEEASFVVIQCDWELRPLRTLWDCRWR